MADAMMMFLGEAHGVNWYWAQPGEFENPGVYYWDGAKNVLCVPHLAAAPEAPEQTSAWRPNDANDTMRHPEACDLYDGSERESPAQAEQTKCVPCPICGANTASPNPLNWCACPKQPAQASAVDERAAFEAWWKGDLLDWRGHQNTAALHAWEGWQARAALAQKGGAA